MAVSLSFMIASFKAHIAKKNPNNLNASKVGCYSTTEIDNKVSGFLPSDVLSLFRFGGELNQGHFPAVIHPTYINLPSSEIYWSGTNAFVDPLDMDYSDMPGFNPSANNTLQIYVVKVSTNRYRYEIKVSARPSWLQDHQHVATKIINPSTGFEEGLFTYFTRVGTLVVR